MDPSFPEFYENTCFHLQNTFQSIKTWDIEASQQSLRSMANQYQKFPEILLIIITSDKNEENLRIAAASYFINFIKEKNQAIPALKLEKKLYFINLIYQIFVDEKLPIKIKRQFLGVFTEILECDLDEKLMFDILDKIDKNLADAQKVANFTAGILCFIGLYSKKSYSNCELLFNCFHEEALPKIKGMLKLTILKAMNMDQEIEIEKISENLNLLCEVFQVYIQCMKEKNERFLGFFFEDLDIMLDLQGVANIGKTMIFMSENPNLWRNLIEAKITSLKILHFLGQIYFENEQKLVNFPLFGASLNVFLKEIIAKLVDFAGDFSNISKVLSNSLRNENRELIFQYFALLNVFAQEAKNKQIYDIFASCKENVVSIVLLPLLLTSSDEIVEFTENPSEFVDFSSKIAENINFETLKSVCSVILSALCSKIDGCLTYVFRSIAENFKSWLKNEGSLPNFQNLLFFSEHISVESRVEASILILSILSHLITKRMDLLTEMEDLLDSFFEILFVQNKNKLIKSRLCLFASYYIFELFKKNHSHRYLYLFQFIFDCLNETIENRAVVLQAIETLNYVVIDNTDFERMKLIINHVLEFVKSSQTIEKIQEFSFFEFLSTVIKNYNILIRKDLFAKLIQSLIFRISQEIKVKSNKNILEGCLNGFLLICEDDYILEHFLEEIEVNIDPLVTMLYSPQSVESYDVILMIFYRVMQEKKSVPKYLLQDPLLLQVIFGNNKNSFGNLFQVINQFLVYGREVIIGNLNLLDEIVKICQMAMENKSNDDLNQIKAALLLHLVFQIYKDFIQNETLLRIFEVIGKTLSTFSKSEYSYLVFFEIYLLGIIYLPTLTLQYLSSTQKLSEILEKISKINYLSCFPYDIQILILTFCSLILSGSLEIFTSPVFRRIFTLVVEIQAFNHLKKNHTILSPLSGSKIKQIDSKRKADQTLQKEPEIELEEQKDNPLADPQDDNDDLDSIDYNESQSFQYQFEHPSQKLESLVRMFINPIRKENEIQYFQETMRKLKNERKEVWDGFLDDLSEKNREKMNEIMSLRKIEDNEGGREHKYRKIIRIKGKKNAKTVNFENQEMEYKNSLYFDLNQDF